MNKKIVLAASGLMLGAGAAAMAADPDVVLCQLYSFSQRSTDGTVRGMAVATTSWNIGDADFEWQSNPNPRHPTIAMNMYRLKDDRFEQLGTSWVKHGFFALASFQCDMPNLPNCTFEPGHGAGDWLGQGCTDTYGVSLNDGGLGPRFEINPWNGDYSYTTSILNTGVGYPPDNKQQVRVQDADMNPALNAGASYFFEGYYVHFDDINHMNSAAWKPCTPNRNGSGNYTFTQTGSGTLPNWGFAIDAWTGASQTVIAEEVPVIEKVSPDGRSILGYKVTDNGDGTWHYEYAVLNVDMDRQVDEFAIPVPAGVNITNIGFHAPAHTEPRAWVGGPTINNDAWSATVSGGEIRWSTTTNPIRWGTLYNFRFDADTAPQNADADVSLFREISGRPDSLSGATQGPSAPAPGCPADLAMNGTIDIDDLNVILAAFGSNVGIGSPTDLANNDGVIDIDDLNVILAAFGSDC